MSIEIMTKTDFNDFKLELKELILRILNSSQPFKKDILSNEELMELLNVSSSTLRKYRVTGKLTYSKVDGLIYYEYKDIQNFIRSFKTNTLSKKLNSLE